MLVSVNKNFYNGSEKPAVYFDIMLAKVLVTLLCKQKCMENNMHITTGSTEISKIV